LRKLVENPDRMMADHVSPGMTVLEIGCGMGFFSLPLARMTGERGRVICVDLQEKMLSKLRSRAKRAGLDGVIETRLCGKEDLSIADLDDRVDFILAMHVIHEVPDPAGAFNQLMRTMRPGGTMLFGEPKARVSESDFSENLRIAEVSGFRKTGECGLKKSLAVFMEAPPSTG